VERNTVVQSDALTFCQSLADESVDVFWSSPPYNLEDAFRPGSGQNWKNKMRYAVPSEGARTFGDGCVKPEPVYQQEQAAVLTEWHRALRPDGVAFYNHKVRIKDGRAISPLEWIRQTPFVLIQELVWDRGASQNVDTRRFLPVSERVYVLAKQPGYKLDNANRMHDVLRIPKSPLRRAAVGHPCPTNPLVVKSCLSVVPKPTDGRRLLVVDCYGGSGTTALVAASLGMDFLLADLAEEYVSLTRGRLLHEWLMAPKQQELVVA